MENLLNTTLSIKSIIDIAFILIIFYIVYIYGIKQGRNTPFGFGKFPIKEDEPNYSFKSGKNFEETIKKIESIVEENAILEKNYNDLLKNNSSKSLFNDGILDSISRQLLLAIRKIEEKNIVHSDKEVDCNIKNIANELYINNLLSNNTTYQMQLLEKMKEMQSVDYIIKQKRNHYEKNPI